MSSGTHSFCKWRPHPWHGLPVGPRPPELVDVYVEITPMDPIKYEIDKETGYLRVDRPQKGASLPPMVYGFIPRTYCGKRVGALSPVPDGDEDPLDVCVLTERPLGRAEVVLTARVVGGIQMVDEGKSDDKIIAVMEPDDMWGGISGIDEVPKILIERMTHYFLTYKSALTGDGKVELKQVFDAGHARKVIAASIEDYKELFGEGTVCE